MLEELREVNEIATGERRSRDSLNIEPPMRKVDDMEGEARRISYEALGEGVPVRASGGEEIGTVEHVLEVPELDVFDGIVLKTSGGLRFADADQVADITDRYVVLNLPAEEAERLG